MGWCEDIQLDFKLMVRSSYTFDGSELSIVHLAAVPAPGRVPDQVAFQNNIISTYNIFEAARKLKIKNIISASSETVLGLPMVSIG